jgi:glycosyltransferase involved in cell wall biosynthesis
VYVDPDNIEELSFAIQKLLDDPALRDSMIIDGYVHAQQFKQERIAKNIMEVYLRTLAEK